MKAILLFLITSTLWSFTFDATVYEALKANSAEKIENAVSYINQQPVDLNTQAYKGTLLMKQADFASNAGKKLKLFKEGHELLENSIKADPNNVEYRFLRLTVQENAPKIVHYSENIEEDKKAIIIGYKHLDERLKSYIKSYTQQSSILLPNDLKR